MESMSIGLAFCYIIAALLAVNGLDYSLVRSLGSTCPHLDSCQEARNSRSRHIVSIRERNCECDSLCVEYGDCCIDAPALKENGPPPGDWHCFELRQFGGVYMKGRCPADYAGPPEMIERCESNATVFEDPMGSMPITDVQTGRTYKNYYCGLCHDLRGDVIVWTPRLECPSLAPYRKNASLEWVLQKLSTNGNGSWGLSLESENGTTEFHDCDIDPIMPPLLEHKIRLCRPDLWQNCPKDWTDEYTRTLCKTYMGARYVLGEGYRNVHCALCLNVTGLSCKVPNFREFYFRSFEHHAFSVLLDVNERLGRDVGFSCDPGQVYDPFFGRCRTMTGQFLPRKSKFSPLMGYVTAAGLGISMICLALHLMAFCLVSELRNLSGKNLASQCLALFLAYSVFLAGQFRLEGALCTTLAFLTLYFFEASFFWMAAMAYDVWRTLRLATTELRFSGATGLRFLAYAAFSWITPILLVMAAGLAEYTDFFPEAYKPGFGQYGRCWFGRRRALLIFFACPLVAIMAANVLLFASSARMIVITTRAGKGASPARRRHFRLYLRLALLMGLTWIVGLVAGYADLDFLWYAFAILNSLQGLFVFAAFTCTDKVISALRTKFAANNVLEFSKTSSSGSSSVLKKTPISGRKI